MYNNQGQNNNIINETKGRGLFYGVIAIATFIVMAVGATFAYFTATTESMNSSVQTGSTTLQLEYINYGSAWMKNDLIPADTAIVEYSVERQNDTTITKDEDETYEANGKNTICKDDYGNSICSIYVFQVTNTAASPQVVAINVVSEKNSFTNLYAMAYQVDVPEDTTNYESEENNNRLNDPIFKKNAEDTTEGAIQVTDGQNNPLYEGQYNPIYINRVDAVKTLLQYTVTGADQTTSRAPALDRLLVSLPTEGDETLEAADRTAKIADNVTIEEGTTKTFAIILYIKNLNEDQTGVDAKRNFSGQVVVSSGDGGVGVSGQISAFTDDEGAEDNLQSNQQNQPTEPNDQETQG